MLAGVVGFILGTAFGAGFGFIIASLVSANRSEGDNE